MRVKLQHIVRQPHPHPPAAAVRLHDPTRGRIQQRAPAAARYNVPMAHLQIHGRCLEGEVEASGVGGAMQNWEGRTRLPRARDGCGE